MVTGLCMVTLEEFVLRVIPSRCHAMLVRGAEGMVETATQGRNTVSPCIAVMSAGWITIAEPERQFFKSNRSFQVKADLAL